MKNIKTKIKSIGLIIAMALYSSIGFAQEEESIVPATEEVVTNIVDENSQPTQDSEAVNGNEGVADSEEKKAETVDPVVEDENELDRKAGGAESEEKEIVINSLEETILFKFLQDNAFLREARKLLDDNPTPPSWVLDPLSQQLYEKLFELAENENFPVSDLDIRAADENGSWSDFVKHYPNLSDLFSLFADSNFKYKFWNNEVHFTDEIESIKQNRNRIVNDADYNLEVLSLIYTDTLNNYLEFIKQNEEVFKKIKTIANNNFKIENDNQVKMCVKFRNRDYCSAPATKPIKSLRELMAHVLKN